MIASLINIKLEIIGEPKQNRTFFNDKWSIVTVVVMYVCLTKFGIGGLLNFMFLFCTIEIVLKGAFDFIGYAS